MESENKIVEINVPENTEEQKINRNAVDRIKICLQCEHFLKLTKQCKKCGCFMIIKTRLPNATCPIGKW